MQREEPRRAMRAAEVPGDLRRFILTSVPSVPYLEAILQLRGEAHVAWDPARLAGRLYVPEREADELLRALANAGIARPSDYRYEPAPDLAAMLDRLAHEYATNLVGVTDIIHSRIDKRAHQFADAFRLRKDHRGD
jgi:hypothetical protein